MIDEALWHLEIVDVQKLLEDYGKLRELLYQAIRELAGTHPRAHFVVMGSIFRIRFDTPTWGTRLACSARLPDTRSESYFVQPGG